MGTLILVGASVRAAAMSAQRAGWTPWCLDLFCDSDLRQYTRHAYRCPVGQWPQGLVSIFKDAPSAPWIYTGGLENHPNLIRELSELRPLWGNGPNELLRSRNPFHVAKLLLDAKLPCLEVRDSDAELPDYTRWLRKPYHGSGGIGIEEVQGPLPAEQASLRTVYHQAFCEGRAYSTVYLGDGFEEARLLGSTQQLIGQGWLNASRFQYCGNIGPIVFPESIQATLRDLGRVVVEGCKLKGLFGIDWILSEEQPWLVEINPRYPASLEILEMVNGQAFLQGHAEIFGNKTLANPTHQTGTMVVGKAIYYARRDFAMPQMRSLRSLGLGDYFDFPANADLPLPGEIIQAGWPVLSLFESAPTVGECRRKLQQFADDFHFDLLNHLEKRT
jgi:predicted ATP-grasp superfamily ATP-dependent carboligase